MKHSYHNRTYKPRSVRVRDSRSKKKFIWSIVISLLLIYLVIAWILPLLIGGFSSLNKPKGAAAIKNTAADITLAPPILNIPFEATNSASIDIPGYAAPNSKIELYLDDNLSQTTNSQDDGSFTFHAVGLSLGTNNVYGKTVGSDQKSSLASKNIQVVYSDDKPKLTLGEPEDHKTIQGGDKKVQVSGDTDPANTISVNNQIVIVGNDGHFSVPVNINENDNTITVIATNKVGNSTQIQRIVTYHP